MTTNIDRAVKRILDAETEYRGHPYDVYPEDLRRWIQVLADENLLMPDLPSPDQVIDMQGIDPVASWQQPVRPVTGSPTTPPVVFIDEDTDMPPAEAREYALAILAAADYAERNQK